MTNHAKLNSEQMEEITFKAIRKIINKFRENPRYFFSESDLHSYFYHCVYSSKMEFLSKDELPIVAIHREYPTNFRYQKVDFKKGNMQKYAKNPFGEAPDTRGNYDIAIINPDFIQNFPWEHIRNKKAFFIDERRNERYHEMEKELLFSIEFKYVINDSNSFISEVRADNNKLVMAKKTQCEHAVNLVFCDISPDKRKNLDKIREETLDASPEILSVFIHSYYNDKGKKITPKPVRNPHYKVPVKQSSFIDF